MRRKINVQLISISIIAIISTMLVMLFVFYDLFQTQVQDDLSANAIVLKNTGIFHSGNENALHMDYRKLRVTWISATGTVLYDNDADVGTMVWIPATGEKYHSIPNCGRMNPDTARQVSRSEAEAMGYGPCSKCY